MELRKTCSCGSTIEFKEKDIKTEYKYIKRESIFYSDDMKLLSIGINDIIARYNGLFKNDTYDIWVDVKFDKIKYSKITKIKFNCINCPLCNSKNANRISEEDYSNEKVIDKIKYFHYKIVENSKYINSKHKDGDEYELEKLDINDFYNPKENRNSYKYLSIHERSIASEITEKEFNKLKKEFKK